MPTQVNLNESERQFSIVSEFNAKTFADLNVRLDDGVLHFASTLDFAAAFDILGNSNEEQIDAWTASIGFDSWGKEHRALLDRFSTIAEFDRRTFLTPAQGTRFYLEKDNTLQSYAHSFLLSEITSLEGTVYVDGHLNYFAGAHHIMLSPHAGVSIQEVLADPTKDFGELVYVALGESVSIKENDEKEFKGFNCPYSNVASNTYVFGHRKEVSFEGRRNRCRFELGRRAYYVEISDPNEPDRWIFNTNITIVNEKRSGFTWIGTFPDFDYGVLGVVIGIRPQVGNLVTLAILRLSSLCV